MAGAAPLAASAAWTRLGASHRSRTHCRAYVCASVPYSESFRRITRHPESASDSAGNVLYFGYGANISSSALKTRGVSPSAGAVGRADGWALNFIHRGGYATIDRDKESTAWGSVHRICKSELVVIRKWETGYKMVEMDVDVLNGDGPITDKRKSITVKCIAFVTKPSARLPAPVVPFNLYADKLVKGAEEVGLPNEYLQMLRRARDESISRKDRGPEYFDVPTVPQLVKRWFSGEV